MLKVHLVALSFSGVHPGPCLPDWDKGRVVTLELSWEKSCNFAIQLTIRVVPLRLGLTIELRLWDWEDNRVATLKLGQWRVQFRKNKGKETHLNSIESLRYLLMLCCLSQLHIPRPRSSWYAAQGAALMWWSAIVVGCALCSLDLRGGWERRVVRNK